jgi:hypothetical protein
MRTEQVVAHPTQPIKIKTLELKAARLICFEANPLAHLSKHVALNRKIAAWN